MDPVAVPIWTASPSADDAHWAWIEAESAAAGARRRATALAERVGFSAAALGRIQLATTEAATNLAKHARRGEMLVRIVRAGRETALEIVCIDHGPGMADVPASQLDGHSTAGSLGIGLGAIERLADDSGVYSVPREGTVLFARFREPTAPPGPASHGATPHGPPPHGPAAEGATIGWPFAGITRPIDGEEECGDTYAAVLHEGVVYAMLCDGLGHGPMAERASREAVRAVARIPLPARPTEIVKRIDHELTATRGGAVAVAAVDPAAHRVRFAGLGNVAAWILGPDRRQGMISVPGIAGARATAAIREHEYALQPGAAVVLHSDGLTGSWSPAARPGLAGLDPLLTAAILLRDAGVRHDDRGVLVVSTSGWDRGS